MQHLVADAFSAVAFKRFFYAQGRAPSPMPRRPFGPMTNREFPGIEGTQKYFVEEYSAYLPRRTQELPRPNR